MTERELLLEFKKLIDLKFHGQVQDLLSFLRSSNDDDVLVNHLAEYLNDQLACFQTDEDAFFFAEKFAASDGSITTPCIEKSLLCLGDDFKDNTDDFNFTADSLMENIKSPSDNEEKNENDGLVCDRKDYETCDSTSPPPLSPFPVLANSESGEGDENNGEENLNDVSMLSDDQEGYESRPTSPSRAYNPNVRQMPNAEEHENISSGVQNESSSCLDEDESDNSSIDTAGIKDSQNNIEAENFFFLSNSGLDDEAKENQESKVLETTPLKRMVDEVSQPSQIVGNTANTQHSETELSPSQQLENNMKLHIEKSIASRVTDCGDGDTEAISLKGHGSDISPDINRSVNNEKCTDVETILSSPLQKTEEEILQNGQTPRPELPANEDDEIFRGIVKESEENEGQLHKSHGLCVEPEIDLTNSETAFPRHALQVLPSRNHDDETKYSSIDSGGSCSLPLHHNEILLEINDIEKEKHEKEVQSKRQAYVRSNSNTSSASSNGNVSEVTVEPIVIGLWDKHPVKDLNLQHKRKTFAFGRTSYECETSISKYVANRNVDIKNKQNHSVVKTIPKLNRSERQSQNALRSTTINPSRSSSSSATKSSILIPTRKKEPHSSEDKKSSKNNSIIPLHSEARNQSRQVGQEKHKQGTSLSLRPPSRSKASCSPSAPRISSRGDSSLHFKEYLDNARILDQRIETLSQMNLATNQSMDKMAHALEEKFRNVDNVLSNFQRSVAAVSKHQFLTRKEIEKIENNQTRLERTVENKLRDFELNEHSQSQAIIMRAIKKEIRSFKIEQLNQMNRYAHNKASGLPTKKGQRQETRKGLQVEVICSEEKNDCRSQKAASTQTSVDHSCQVDITDQKSENQGHIRPETCHSESEEGNFMPTKDKRIQASSTVSSDSIEFSPSPCQNIEHTPRKRPVKSKMMIVNESRRVKSVSSSKLDAKTKSHYLVKHPREKIPEWSFEGSLRRSLRREWDTKDMDFANRVQRRQNLEEKQQQAKMISKVYVDPVVDASLYPNADRRLDDDGFLTNTSEWWENLMKKKEQAEKRGFLSASN